MNSALRMPSSRMSWDSSPPRPIAMWNTARSAWENSNLEQSMLCGHYPLCSETLPKSGMMRNGVLYELPMSGHPTDANASSSLLSTPNARDWKDFPGKNYNAGGLPREVKDLLPTPRNQTGGGGGIESGMRPEGARRTGPRTVNLLTAVALLPTPVAGDQANRMTRRYPSHEDGTHGLSLASEVGELARSEQDWGKYEPAIRRWEEILGRAAPEPTVLSPRGNPRLNPVFAEWVMGLPEGWVTSAGLSRREQLHTLGNGVVPQQAAYALRMLISSRSTRS